SDQRTEPLSQGADRRLVVRIDVAGGAGDAEQLSPDPFVDVTIDVEADDFERSRQCPDSSFSRDIHVSSFHWGWVVVGRGTNREPAIRAAMRAAPRFAWSARAPWKRPSIASL